MARLKGKARISNYHKLKRYIAKLDKAKNEKNKENINTENAT